MLRDETKRIMGGNSMIADPTIAEPVKEEPLETCFCCAGLATHEIKSLRDSASIVICENHAHSIWLLLEALALDYTCEVGKRK